MKSISELKEGLERLHFPGEDENTTSSLRELLGPLLELLECHDNVLKGIQNAEIERNKQAMRHGGWCN